MRGTWGNQREAATGPTAFWEDLGISYSLWVFPKPEGAPGTPYVSPGPLVRLWRVSMAAA